MAAPHGSKIHMSRGLVASPMVYLKKVENFRAKYRIILSADTASEVRQMLSQKRR